MEEAVVPKVLRKKSTIPPRLHAAHIPIQIPQVMAAKVGIRVMAKVHGMRSAITWSTGLWVVNETPSSPRKTFRR